MSYDLSLFSDLYKDVHGIRPRHAGTQEEYGALLKMLDEDIDALPAKRAEWLKMVQDDMGKDVTYSTLIDIVEKIGPSHPQYDKSLNYLCSYPV